MPRRAGICCSPSAISCPQKQGWVQQPLLQIALQAHWEKENGLGRWDWQRLAHCVLKELKNECFLATVEGRTTLKPDIRHQPVPKTDSFYLSAALAQTLRFEHYFKGYSTLKI